MSSTLAAPSGDWMMALSSLLGCIDPLQVWDSTRCWLFGLFLGMIVPRYRQLANLRGFLFSSLTVVIGLGSHSQLPMRFAMLINGAIFIQSLWYRWTDPGTFHRLWGSLVSYLTGNRKEALMRHDAPSPAADTGGHNTSEWYIDDADLEFFISRVNGTAPVRADPWEPLLQKEITDQLQYCAWRRMLKDIKKTEYLSTSFTSDTSPQEVMDFYLADPVRQQWDGLLSIAETVQDGDFKERQQVVHWVRSFPFAFLSDRDYIIARRAFTRGDVLYGISKVVKRDEHEPGNTVQMDQYWSMWSCEPVQCPFKSGRIATKTTLLHMEDFKIPEHLSRFAVKAGMWGFVKKMTPYMSTFVQDRRARGVSPSDTDPNAFGAPLEDGAVPDTRNIGQTKKARRQRGGFGKFALTVAATAILVVAVRRSRPSSGRNVGKREKLVGR